MGEPADERSVDVVVFAGPGLGHYHPIAAFLSELVDPGRVAICSQVRADHAMVRKIRDDGFRFVPWPVEAQPPSGAALRAARRLLLRRAVPWLAARSAPTAALPSGGCRSVFAFSSLLAPIADGSAERGAALGAVLDELRPRLVVTETNEDWIAVLAAERHIDWAYYTTGPVSTVVRGRPVGPAGFPPTMDLPTRVTNSALRSAKQLRQMARDRRITRATGDGARREPLAKFAMTCDALDAYPGLVGHDIDYVGLTPYRRPDWWPPEPSDLARGEHGSVVVTWGSDEHQGDADFFDRLLPALIELADARPVVVVSSLDRVRGAVAAAGRPGLRVVPPSDAPPYELLRDAAVVVTHGGYGTIKEAVAMGAAVVVASEVVADRMETARRVLVSGVGRSVCRATADTAALRAAIHAALGDPDIRSAVDSTGRELRDPSRRTELVRRLSDALT